jgi:tRNA (adenine37-N6)-methyltransferase
VDAISLRPIGVIHTRYTSFDDVPVQAALNGDEEGVIDVDPRYAEGLDDLADFSHAWLLTWLGPTDGTARPEPSLRQVPFLLAATQRHVGIFAMRGPRRPNPIGLSLVRIVGVDSRQVSFAGVDVIDGTPLLDLKPYFSDADSPTGDLRCGWYESVDLGGPITPRELGASPSP